MISYAGIGSRDISSDEECLIMKIANKLSSLGIIVYSGNAEGSDIAFQSGSNGNCVIMLPWLNFNKNEYDVKKSLAYFDLGDTKEGNFNAEKHHPNFKNLSQGAKRMMSRNYHQVIGYDIYPKVSFIVCCADEDEYGVKGGTGQACRIAKYNKIPIFNIRNGWDNQKEEFSNLIRKLVENRNEK